MGCVFLYIVHGQVYYFRSVTECNTVRRSSQKGPCILASVRTCCCSQVHIRVHCIKYVPHTSTVDYYFLYTQHAPDILVSNQSWSVQHKNIYTQNTLIYKSHSSCTHLLWQLSFSFKISYIVNATHALVSLNKLVIFLISGLQYVHNVHFFGLCDVFLCGLGVIIFHRI